MNKQIQLTGVDDVDILILLEIDDKTLFDICAVNLSPLCNNENFWMHRTIHQLGDITGRFVLKYKPKNETYKEQYYKLKELEQMFVDNLHTFIDELPGIIDSSPNLQISKPRYPGFAPKYHLSYRYLPFFKYVITRPDFIISRIIYMDEYRNQFVSPITKINDVQLWDAYKEYIFTTLNKLFFDIDHETFLNWLLTQDIPELFDFIGPLAAKFGRIDVLDYLYNNYKHLYNNQDYNHLIYGPFAIMWQAMYYGQIDVLEWLMNKGFRPEIHFLEVPSGDNEIINVLRTLKFLFEHGFLNPHDIRDWDYVERSLVSGPIEIIDWFASIGILPMAHDLIDIISGQEEELDEEKLDWLFDKGLLTISDDLRKYGKYICADTNRI